MWSWRTIAQELLGRGICTNFDTGQEFEQHLKRLSQSRIVINNVRNRFTHFEHP